MEKLSLGASEAEVRDFALCRIKVMKAATEMTDLSFAQAYRAMFYFLQAYYERTSADDVGALLGGMHLQEDERPADSAIWSEWLLAATKVLRES